MKRYAISDIFGYDFQNWGLLLDQTVTNNAGCAKDFSFPETFDRHVFSRKTLRGKKFVLIDIDTFKPPKIYIETISNRCLNNICITFIFYYTLLSYNKYLVCLNEEAVYPCNQEILNLWLVICRQRTFSFM